jgi:hypothetical protein
MIDSNETIAKLRRTATIRVLKLGRAAGWSDRDIGALLHHFEAPLIRHFDRDDVHLADGRVCGRCGVAPARYDEAAWAVTMADLEGAQ